MYISNRSIVSDSLEQMKRDFNITFKFVNFTKFKVLKEDKEYQMDADEICDIASKHNITVEEVIKKIWD